AAGCGLRARRDHARQRRRRSGGGGVRRRRDGCRDARPRPRCRRRRAAGGDRMNPPVVVTIAGTDSGGAAGIAADLATFAALGVHGACVVTAVTAQDTTGVRAIHPVPYDVVAAQLDAVLEDLDPVAVKTGMLATP